ncbi:divalent-cation tolerance protein CutA [Luteococcus sp.]|uniref:divalent-cation tolerance protein CutA n=1 Tax=Luteococcus sp. TaxID=1969402 RepID=UPI0037367089
MQDNPIAVAISGPNENQLGALCRTLVNERLAASANITPQIRSIYWWNEAVQDHAESLALLHTVRAAFPSIIARVKELHPYQLPQIVCMPIDASPEYLAWIRSSTAQRS